MPTSFIFEASRLISSRSRAEETESTTTVKSEEVEKTTSTLVESGSKNTKG